jgi:hypothetical protein
MTDEANTTRRHHRAFLWPQQAIELVTIHHETTGSDLGNLITQLVQISGHPRDACWRFARKQGITAKPKPCYRRWSEAQDQQLLGLIEKHSVAVVASILQRSKVAIWNRLTRLGVTARKGPRNFSWSAKAKNLIVANRKACGQDLQDLITSVARESGNPRCACWRFARQMGARGKVGCRPWTEAEQHRLLQLIERRPVAEVAKSLRRTERAVRMKLFALGANARIGKDWFTPGSLAVVLRASRETVQKWIDRGWLKATEQRAGTMKWIVITADDFSRFCKEHRAELFSRRVNAARVDFILNFVFAPEHAQLLKVRTSYKKRAPHDTAPAPERSSADQVDTSEVEADTNDFPQEAYVLPTKRQEPEIVSGTGEMWA